MDARTHHSQRKYVQEENPLVNAYMVLKTQVAQKNLYKKLNKQRNPVMVTRTITTWNR